MAVLKRAITKPKPPLEYTPQAAARDARRIAETYTINLIPLDVEGLAVALGVKVRKVPLEPNVSGYLEKSPSGWEIGVNSLHHPNRRRFTIAHEIGHFMLHRDGSGFRDGLLFRKSAQSNPQEREANQFASLLLMPESDFQSMMSRYDIEEVARRFGVSRQAAEYRYMSVHSRAEID